jgi:hypothetical protein
MKLTTALLGLTVLIEVAGLGSLLVMHQGGGLPLGGAAVEPAPAAPVQPKALPKKDAEPPREPLPAFEPPAPKKPAVPAKPDDERVKKAQKQKEDLESRERELLKATGLNIGNSVARLQKSIDAMRPGDLEAEQVAVEDLRSLVIELRSLAREILAKQPEYQRLLALYQSELRKAPESFRPAADVFDQMSAEEPIQEFSDRYKRLALSLRDLAKVMEKRSSDLVEEEKEISTAYKYVAAAEKYLTGLNEWLASYPTFTAGRERQKQIQELKNFIRYFRELDAAFDRFNRKVASNESKSS